MKPSPHFSDINLSVPIPHIIPCRCNLSVSSCPFSVINQCFILFPVFFRILSNVNLIAFVAISLSLSIDIFPLEASKSLAVNEAAPLVSQSR